MKDLGVYIHIPFCIKKCNYCDFFSCDNKFELIPEYIETIIEEILHFRKKEKQDFLINTIYIGGGTPSVIDAEYIVKIMQVIKDNFNINKNAEITIEINPGTVTKEKLTRYFNCGINRLSIGLQSTNNNLLKLLGRIHNFEEFKKIYVEAREIGFKNINIDLMFGLPNQTLDDLNKTLDKVLELNPEHISTYSLIVEENTKLEQQINEKILILPSQELERKMYWYIKKVLEQNGYKHYEISNFAKIGKESKHNVDCWKQKEYIGFGAGAHSYFDNIRFCNEADLEKYLQKEFKYIINEKQNKEEKQKEYIMLGLRMLDGINKQEYKNIFSEDIEKYRKELDKLQEAKLLVEDDKTIKLTKKGLDLANIVFQEFV